MTDRPFRPLTSAPRLFAIVVGLALAGCGTAPAPTTPPSLEPGPGRWRVVERSGEATLTAGAGLRRVAMARDTTLPAAANLTTGPASQLILSRGGIQATLGPRTRVGLTGLPQRQVIEQDRGLGRYRIAGAPATSLRVLTPTGSVESEHGTIEVDVAPGRGRTVVTVVDGEARIAASGGTRTATIRAGQSAELGRDGERLALRRTWGAPLEPVVPVILPATAPKLDATVDAVGVSPGPDASSVTHAGARSEARAHAVAVVGQQRRSPGSAAPNMVTPQAAPIGRAPELAPAEVGSPGGDAAGEHHAIATAADAAPAAAGAAQQGADDSPKPPLEPPVVERVIVPARFSEAARDLTVDRPGAGSDGPVPTPALPTPGPPADRFDLMTRGLLDGLDPHPIDHPYIGAR